MLTQEPSGRPYNYRNLMNKTKEGQKGPSLAYQQINQKKLKQTTMPTHLQGGGIKENQRKSTCWTRQLPFL